MQANQKTPHQNDSASNPSSTDPLTEAIREIEAALAGDRLPEKTDQDSPSVFQDASAQEGQSENLFEPEFHSMESNVSRRNLEQESSFYEFYPDTSLETKSTFEDVFPESEYFDDSFNHAHPESEPQSSSPYEVKPQKAIINRLKNKQDLTDAIVLQTILNRRPFPPRQH